MPTLDELRSAAIISGTPDTDDLIPYYDVSEYGNGSVKKTTVADLLADLLAGLSPGAGVTDGDKGDVEVSSGGTSWTVPDLALKANLSDGNAFVGPQSFLSSTPLNIERATSSTATPVGAAGLIAKSTGDAVNGFGPIIPCYITDTGVSDQPIGAFGFVRAGADNTGDFVVRPQVAGVATELFRVTSTGTIVLDGDTISGTNTGDQLLDFLNVLDYGAVGDGVTDDTAAFEACFAAGVTAGVKKVCIPAGEYVLNTLVVPPAFHLIGASPAGATAWDGAISPANLTRFLSANATADVLKCEIVRSTVIENIEIEHVSASVTSTGYGIRIENATPGVWPGAPFRLINCTIRNFARGLYNDSGNRIHIEGCHLVQCDYGYYSTGVTSTLSCINSELGGVPKDGGNGQAWYLSNAQGATFLGCEFGNCYRVGNIEGSSVVDVAGCNFETISGPYSLGITTGRLSITSSSVAGAAGAFVRNTGSAANVVSFDGFTIRSGGTVIFDGRAVGYETSVDNDSPVMANTSIAWRRMTSDFVTTKELHSDRDPLPFGAVPEIQRPSLSSAYETAAANSGAVFVGPRGLSLRTWTTAGSTAVVNLADQADAFGGYAYAPVMARAGDTDITSLDWSRRMVIRFAIQRVEQGIGSTSDNQAAVLFGVPYNRTTTGALADKGIGIQISNTSVTAVVHNGSTGTSVALGTIADKAKKIVVLDYDGAGTLKASLTGHYDVTRTGGPTGDGAGYSNSILFAAWNTAGGTSQPHYSFSDLEIAYY